MNCSANSPGIQLSFFSESLNTIICGHRDQLRSIAAESMDQLIRDRGWKKGEDYKYSDSKTKVSMICPKGHRLEITPKDFKGGNGCAKCSGACSVQARENFEYAINERGWQKGEDYTYVNNSVKVSVVCPYEHSCWIAPYKFKSGSGCAICAGSCPQQAQKEFEQLIEARGYLKGPNYEYVSTSSKVFLICPSGHLYKVAPCSFKDGDGCMSCSKICPRKAEERLEHLIKDRGYQKEEDYVYVNARTAISLICFEGHKFRATPTNLKSGQGCPGCALHGFNQCIPATLYYIAFYPWPNRVVYKIGITNRSVKDRYRQCKTPYRILMEKQFESGLDCLNEETRLNRKHRKHRCKDAPVDTLGRKELFGIDVLGLDVGPHP